jgi:hypothetical protein
MIITRIRVLLMRDIIYLKIIIFNAHYKFSLQE